MKLLSRFSLFALLFSLLGFCAGPVQAQAVPPNYYDVSVTAQTPAITFSPATFYAGDNVRIYGLLSNTGNKDVSGSMAFFQGTTMIDSMQNFSSRVSGAPEEVWVDWVPTVGTYNISLRIVSATPTDQDFSNNQAVSANMTVVNPPPPPPPAAPTPSTPPSGGSGSGSSGTSGSSGGSGSSTSGGSTSTTRTTSGTSTTSGRTTTTPNNTTSTSPQTETISLDQGATPGNPYEVTTAPVLDGSANSDTNTDSTATTSSKTSNQGDVKKGSQIPMILGFGGMLAFLLLVMSYFVYKRGGKKQEDGFDLE